MNKLSCRKNDLDLCAGDWVEVRSQQEILSTLDDRGALDALPFMPEMLQYCGKRFRVFKLAHKTCDTIKQSRNRRMTNAVHVDGLRCDGAAHGGCQARCLLFWKTAWLKRVDGSKDYPVQALRESRNEIENPKSQCDLGTLRAATRMSLIDGEHAEELYRCQTTDLLQATTALQWWDWRQYVMDLTSRNVRLRDFIRYVMLAIFNLLMRLPSTINENAQRVLNYLASQDQKSYNLQVVDRPPEIMPGFAVRSIKAFLSHYSLPRHFFRYMMIVTIKLLEPLSSRLHSYPYVRGLAKTKTKTPTEVLNLQPGELVQVRSLDEIEHTINKERRNRGLKIDVEMIRYCGGVYRVLARVEKIINEKNGKMTHLFNDCIILEGVTCSGCLSRNRLFCPRSIYPYWREIWLKRLDNGKAERSEAQSESISSLK
jgi:hypothetical protein